MHQNGMKNPLTFLTDKLVFPPVENATDEGLLALGGDLSVERLMLAYKSGIFPWFNEGSPILWWSPDPRMVLFPDRIKISKSMRKECNSGRFRLTKNVCFEAVIEHCAQISRSGQSGTWITNDMKEAYMELHRNGFAKSFEVWEDSSLVGGLYGIDLGHVFCGESMFSLVSNASKYAFIKLAEEKGAENYVLIDCQIYTEHLESLGAEPISRTSFLEYLKN